MSQGYSGVEGNVLVGAVDADTMGWQADYEFNTWDATTTADGGWDDTGLATQKLSGSFDILYNKDKTPFGGIGLASGAIVGLKLYINKSDGVFLAGNGKIIKLSLKGTLKEGRVVTCSFVNSGAWVLPA